MKISFSPELIKYLGIYLDMSLKEIAKRPEFLYSRIYLYKVADGSIPIKEDVNNFFNDFFNDMQLTADDLTNIYSLIDLCKEGKLKAGKLKKVGGK